MSLQPNQQRSGLRGRSVPGVTLLAVLSLTACDFEVTNPGPVADSFLENPTAHQALANGALILLSDALRNVAYTSVAIVREIFPGGSTGSYGITASQQTGVLRFDESNWTNHQRARKVAEDAVERFERIVGDISTYRPAAWAAIWAGYSNRLLGENFCAGVIDGGPEVASTVFLERSEQWFTRAIALGTGAGLPDVAMAARAGRASVRAQLGNWAGAVSDANQVPDNFRFNMNYTTQEDLQYNRIFWAGANQPYRAHTVWRTFYEDYFTETGDPRTPWGRNPNIPRGDAAIAFLSGVEPGSRAPWLFQLKHDRQDSPHALSTGWEMRLTEAEALLRDGNWQAALPLINKNRVRLNLAPWTATSLDEAWTVYKRERGIELWLEGRRMADLRRWAANNSPGDLHPLETKGTGISPEPPSFLVASQSLCFPIPRAEYETNPNLTLPSGAT